MLKAGIEIGNSLDGKRIPEETSHIYLAEGIGHKIIFHTVSAFYLSKGYQLATKDQVFQAQIDFSSIAILARAALESYIAFHHVFVATKEKDELTFRFDCWNLGGFLDRSEFSATEEEHIQLKNYESEQILQLQNKLRQSDIFIRLNSDNKKAVLNGRWRLLNSWSILAVNAGFRKEFFDKQYKFLCSHAHSSRLSIIQVQQTKELKSQYEMTQASLGLLMIVLAKYLYDYTHLIPELNHFLLEDDKFHIINVWKKIGESL